MVGWGDTPTRAERPAEAEWAPPAEFDDYEIVKPLGAGQNGRVYLALDTLLDRHVAIKFLSDARPGPAARRRLLLEARAAARIHHPNVVAIYRVGEHGDRSYLVTEFVRGTTVRTLERPVPHERALEIAIDLARGLAAAHRRGVLHRDLNPGNAIIDEDGTAKILDFGLASLLGSGAGAGAADTVTGTPDYIAPELWRGQPATCRTDVYAMGALLYELAGGRPPHHDVAAADLPRAANQRDVPSLADSVPERFARVIERCLARDPEARYASGEELRAALDEAAAEGAGAAALAAELAATGSDNPYRGLRPFEAEHRSFFFGRAAEVAVILDRLSSEHFVLIAGDSGVGKSSVCRAGVIPAALQGRLGESRAWRTVTIVPGRRPLAALAAALAGILDRPEEEVSELAREPAVLAQSVARRLGKADGLLLFVDQLEELVTLGGPDEVEGCAHALHHLGSGVRGVRLLASARADFLTRIATLPALGDDIGRALYLLRGLSRDGVRQAVVGPARALGAQFESEEMVDALVAAASETGGLPLLQFALAELWQARDQETATITARSLDAVGGVGGSLARHADEVVARLLPDERKAARRLLLSLVTPEGTRARRTGAEIGAADPHARRALEGLVSGRILVAHEVDGQDAYELAHEILLRQWSTLAGWLIEDAGAQRVRERVAQAAAEWQRLGGAVDGLWNKAQLVETERVPDDALSPEEREFLRRSRRHVAARRWRLRLIAAAVPLLVGAGYLGFELHARSRRDARVAVELAAAEERFAAGRAAAARSADLRRAAFAKFDAGDTDAETAQDGMLAAAAEAQRAYAEADARTQAALAVDPSRADIRELHGDILFERALLADAGWRRDLVDELMRQVAFYDEDGERMRRWSAPARLGMTVTPAGAALRLFESVRVGDRFELRPREVPPGARRGDRRVLDLPPGTYLVRLTADGRAPIAMPIRLTRAEKREVQVSLPRAASVPSGFVVVPAGRALVGAAGDEDLRRAFFSAPPLHEVDTGAYLIGRHEVTFAEWIAFLDALPADERARRTPGVTTLGARGPQLARDPSGDWSLSLPLGDHAVSARGSEPLRYPGRSQRSAQDWRRFPVLGVSAEDAEAYAAWLRQSGRVPGARLCTEHEWARGARGADERTFPHGFALAGDDINFDETYGRRDDAMGPDEVGSHPTSRSPFGLDDMAGNAFEWTRSSEQAGEYVARGGSYFDAHLTTQIPNRMATLGSLRDPTVGFRLCADPPEP